MASSKAMVAHALGTAVALAAVAGCGSAQIAGEGRDPITADVRIGGAGFGATGAAGTIEPRGLGVAISLGVDRNPNCDMYDEETFFGLELVVPRIADTPLGEAIDLATTSDAGAGGSGGASGDGGAGGSGEAAPPVQVDVGVSAFMACRQLEPGDAWTITGSLTLTSLSPTSAAGSLSLHLDGDIPCGGGTGIFASDTTLDVSWSSFQVPFSTPSCP